MSSIFLEILPRSWTGCGIVDCPELVMIDTINGAVQSKINKVTHSGWKSSKMSHFPHTKVYLNFLRKNSHCNFHQFWRENSNKSGISMITHSGWKLSKMSNFLRKKLHFLINVSFYAKIQTTIYFQFWRENSNYMGKSQSLANGMRSRWDISVIFNHCEFWFFRLIWILPQTWSWFNPFLRENSNIYNKCRSETLFIFFKHCD